MCLIQPVADHFFFFFQFNTGEQPLKVRMHVTKVVRIYKGKSHRQLLMHNLVAVSN
jgi:hypothetical protein